MCLSLFKLHHSDGTVHRHGPRNAPCAGSDKPPIDAQQATPTQNSQTASSDSLSTTPPKVISTRSVSATIKQELQHPSGHGPLMKHIPRSARFAVASVLLVLLQSVTDTPDDATKWADLLSFGPLILTKPPRGGRKHNLTKLILNRVTLWRAGERSAANSQTSCTRRTSSRTQPTDRTRTLASLVSTKIEEGNFKAALRLVCSDDTPAPDTQETLEALKKKHPSVPSDRRIPPSPDSLNIQPLQVTPEMVKAAIHSFPAGSAGGPDGFTAQHLRDLICSHADLEHGLCDFVNMMMSAKLPDPIREIIFGGNLIALQKKMEESDP